VARTGRVDTRRVIRSLGYHQGVGIVLVASTKAVARSRRFIFDHLLRSILLFENVDFQGFFYKCPGHSALYARNSRNGVSYEGETDRGALDAPCAFRTPKLPQNEIHGVLIASQGTQTLLAPAYGEVRLVPDFHAAHRLHQQGIGS
jgi:hypothetical protein